MDVAYNVLQGLKKMLRKEQAGAKLIHGDTTIMATSLTVLYCQIPVGHVEAALRTHNKLAPFPEGINRQVTSRLTVPTMSLPQLKEILSLHSPTSDKRLL